MEYAIKIIGSSAGLFAAYKIIVEIVTAKSTRRRDEYDFSKRYVTDLNDAATHRFCLEKGFFALTGQVLGVPEIKYLIDLDSPSLSIADRGDASGFIDFCVPESRYTWLGIYRRPNIRKHAVKGFNTGYFLAASVAIFPAALKGLPILATPSTFIFSASFLQCFASSRQRI